MHKAIQAFAGLASPIAVDEVDSRAGCRNITIAFVIPGRCLFRIGSEMGCSRQGANATCPPPDTRG
jgi:hypothetical protein